MDAMKMRTKFEVRSFTRSWDNWGTPKICAVLDTPALPFYQNFQWAFVRMDPVNDPAKFEVRSSRPVHEIIVIGVLGFWVGVANPDLGEQDAV